MADTLGSKIRELRDEHDLSLREFAKKLGGISAAHLSDIELGRRFPSEGLLEKMASVLDISIERLRALDNRAPVDALRRLTLADPTFGLALRTLVDKEITYEDIMGLARNKKDRENP